MDTFSYGTRLLIVIAILLVSGLVARLIPLALGWTALIAAAIAGTLAFVADQWGRRRGPRSG